jgi:hypothetical protein
MNIMHIDGGKAWEAKRIVLQIIIHIEILWLESHMSTFC